MLDDQTIKDQPQSDQEIPWIKQLDKNIKDNRQLDFTGQVFLSCTNTDTMQPDSDMLKLTQVDRKLGTLNLALDTRSEFSRNVQKSKIGCVSVYFPLTKEKMKLLGRMELITSTFNEKESNLKISIDFQTLRQDLWQRLDSEEKKTYKTAKPDIKVGVKDELNTFNSPEVVNLPENFSVVIIHPHKGNKFIMYSISYILCFDKHFLFVF